MKKGADYEIWDVIKEERLEGEAFSFSVISEDGSLFARASKNKPLEIWDTHTFEKLYSFEDIRPDTFIRSLDISKDNKYLVLVRSNVIYIIDLTIGEIIYEEERRVIEGGARFLNHNHNILFIGRNEDAVHYDWKNKKVVSRCTDTNSYKRSSSVQVSPNDKYGLITNTVDASSFLVWELETGETTSLYNNTDVNGLKLATFHPFLEDVVITMGRGNIALYEAKAQGNNKDRFLIRDIGRGSVDLIDSFCFNSSGTRLIVAGRIGGGGGFSLDLWDLEEEKLISSSEKDTPITNYRSFSMGTAPSGAYGVKTNGMRITQFSLGDLALIFEPDKFLFRKDGVIFYKDEEGLLETPSQVLETELFEEYGTRDVSFMKEERDYEVLIMRDTIREEVPKAQVVGCTAPQLIKATKNLAIENVARVNDLHLKGEDENDTLRIIFSLDDGKTWHTKVDIMGFMANTIIDTENFEEIKEKGLTLDEFNSLKEEWTMDFVLKGKIRLGFFFEDETASVDKLTINADLYGYWEVQQNGEDMIYRYTNEKLKVLLLRDGNFKINLEQAKGVGLWS